MNVDGPSVKSTGQKREIYVVVDGIAFGIILRASLTVQGRKVTWLFTAFTAKRQERG